MTPPANLKALINIFIGIINPLLVVIAALSLLAFFWGLISLIFKAGDEKAIEEGKNLMKWGLIALFIMVALLGLIAFLQSSFGFSNAHGPYPLLPPYR